MCLATSVFSVFTEALDIIKAPHFQAEVGESLLRPVRSLLVCDAMQGGAEEESLGFQVCSRECVDTTVLGLLRHLPITTSAKPVLQTHL